MQLAGNCEGTAEAKTQSPSLYFSEMNAVFPDSWIRRRTSIVSVSWLLRIPVPLHLLLLCACAFYSPGVSLTVHLPEAPVHWRQTFPDLGFSILYPTNNGGGFASRRAASRDRVSVLCPKVPYLPVLAYPNIPGQSIDLPPAGGVYPLDCDVAAESISLSWQGGAVAEVLRRLWEQGVDCSSINVPRLAGEIAARCQGDPWALDLERICTGLAAEEFRLTDIRLAPSRDLLVEPGPGNWFLESPFRLPIPADADGSLLLRSVPLGAHTLFETPPAARFFLYGREETILMIRFQPR
jgi:hypothetical protein